MSTRVNVHPNLLLWAVERAGWDDETTDRRAPKLEEWVEGSTAPTFRQLESFAQATHTPLGLLLLSEPPDEKLPIPDMRTIGNVAVPEPSVDLLDTIYMCEARQDWYRSFALENEFEELSFVGSASVSSSPIETAAEIRLALRFEMDDRSSLQPWAPVFRYLVDRIEELGALVMVNGVVGSNTHRKLNPDEFRGLALSDRLAPLIFVNGADTKAAQIFTLVHELAHIWLGESAISDAAVGASDAPQEELWCNAVAAEVLVPLEELRNRYKDTYHTEELERLAKEFSVSTLVILRRIFDADFVSWPTFQSLYQEELRRVMAILDQRESPGGGDYYNVQPLRISRRFGRAVIASALEGSTSYRDAYRLLSVKEHGTFQKLAEKLGV